MSTQYLTDSVAKVKGTGEIIFLKHDTCAEADKFPMKDSSSKEGVKWFNREDIDFIQIIQSDYG